MFKLFVLSLVDISSLEINQALVKQGEKYPKLNDYTVRIYHGVFKLRGRKKNGSRNR